MWYFIWWVPLAGIKQFLHWRSTIIFSDFHQSENQKDIPIFQTMAKNLNRPLNFSIDHQSTSIDHFWSIDQGG